MVAVSPVTRALAWASAAVVVCKSTSPASRVTSGWFVWMALARSASARAAVDDHRHVALGCGDDGFVHDSVGEVLPRLRGAEAEGQVPLRHASSGVAELKVAPRARAMGFSGRRDDPKGTHHVEASFHEGADGLFRQPRKSAHRAKAALSTRRVMASSCRARDRDRTLLWKSSK